MKRNGEKGGKGSGGQGGGPDGERKCDESAGKLKSNSQKTEKREAEKQKGKKQKAEKQKTEKQKTEKQKGEQQKNKSQEPGYGLAERLLLEQSIAKLVNGQTGLLMFLDMLLQDAEEKDLAGFSCHAEGYLRRTEKLKPLFARYKMYEPQSSEAAPYQVLLKIGNNLEKMRTIPSEGLSHQELDTWRKMVLRRMDLYGDREKG